MGNLSTHATSFLGGTGLSAAILGILTQQFHMDGGLAGNWLIVVSAFVGLPLLAYLGVKAQGNPALKAALDALSAMSAQQQANGTGTPGTPAPQATVTVEARGTTAPAQPAPQIPQVGAAPSPAAAAPASPPSPPASQGATA